MTKTILFLLLICACCTPAQAQEGNLYLITTLKSLHENRDHGYNEKNLGIGIQYNLSQDLRLLAGEYKNSFFNKSNYFGIAWLPFHRDNFSAGFLIGEVSGYVFSNLSKYSFIAIPEVTWENGRYLVNIVFVPPVQKAGVVAVQIGVSFF
jgi:hypothetical protein